MDILIVGDVVSKLGRASLERNLKAIRERQKIHFILVNGENISHGKGMNENHYKWLLSLGVHVITLGNHSFHNKDILKFIDDAPNIVRPYNYTNPQAGKGLVTINYNGIKITVFQMLGNVFMKEKNDSPFEKTEEILNTIKSDIYICDFHGEATSEKIAFAHHFDGRIQIIFGTHTHVPTNDARILPKGSAYITDVGMTGSLDGIIGVKKEIVIDRFLEKSKEIFVPENSGKSQFNAVHVILDDINCKVKSIKALQVIE